MQSDAKLLLEEIYQSHHQRKGRYGYLFCQGGRIPHLKKWVGKNKKILDLGCRDGTLTQAYVEGNEVVGVDIDRKALELLHQKLDIETHWLDLNREWTFAEESFDIIVACEILEHLYYPHLFLQRVVKSLKQKGLFIGSVPNAFRIRNRLKFLLGKEFETDKTHVNYFSYYQLHSFLYEFFPTVEIVPLQGKILPGFPVRASSPFFLKRLFARDLLWRAQRS